MLSVSPVFEKGACFYAPIEVIGIYIASFFESILLIT